MAKVGTTMTIMHPEKLEAHPSEPFDVDADLFADKEDEEKTKELYHNAFPTLQTADGPSLTQSSSDSWWQSSHETTASQRINPNLVPPSELRERPLPPRKWRGKFQ
jgi:hypothetical protein